MNTTNYKQDPKTIFELSSGTVQKVIKRANLKCALCDWNKAYGDIHHIIELNQGGSNDMSNLIYLCPNCHRCVHQLGDAYVSKDVLFTLSLSNTIPNWIDYYNPKRNIITDKSHKKCENENCNNLVSYRLKFCSNDCYHKNRYKFIWSKESLTSLLEKYHGVLTKVGLEIGVSDNAVKKQCNNFNLNPNDFRTRCIRSKIIQIT